MKKILLLLAIILMANVNSAMAQGENPYVFAPADGDNINEQEELKTISSLMMARMVRYGVLAREVGDNLISFSDPTTGKLLFSLENESIVHLGEGVTAADRIYYTFTDEQLETNKGGRFEGYTGLTLTFCTETVSSTFSHWQQLTITDPKALEAAFALVALTADNVIKSKVDGSYSDVETDQTLCYRLLEDPENEVVRMAMSYDLTGPKTYNHDLSLATRLGIAADQEMLSQLQALLGSDPREVRTINLTFDPTGIPTNPSADYALNVTDGKVITEADKEETRRMAFIALAMTSERLIKVESVGKDFKVATAEGKELGTIENDQEANSFTFHLAEGVSSDDDLVMEIPDGGRETLAQMYANTELPVTYDPYTVKTVSIRFPASTAISAPTAGDQERADSPFFTIDGRRLQGQPTQKGLYINRGRKVVVK